MASDGFFDSLASFFTDVEALLNKWGYVPFIGTLIGIGRILIGIAQYHVGAILSVISAIAAVTAQATGAETFNETCFQTLGLSIRQLPNGALNVIRGVFELFPFVGGWITKTYDELRGDRKLFGYHIE